jgi:hypothetical protein
MDRLFGSLRDNRYLKMSQKFSSAGIHPSRNPLSRGVERYPPLP